MTSLTVEGLSKHYGAYRALDDVNVTMAAGELLVLLGPSGSGKTTLLRSVAGLVEPTAGRIVLGETAVKDVRTGIDVPSHKRNLGMVFQNFALWPHMTVRDNVGYPLKSRGWDSSRREARVSEMLTITQCLQYGDRLPSMLSGGQQQRIALARALSAQPGIILFDEPLSNLDALLRIELRSQLRMIHRQTGFTGIYVTHDQIEALSIGSRVAVMNKGVIEQIGSPEELYDRPATSFAAEFLGMTNIIVARRDRKDTAIEWQPDAADGSESHTLHFRPEHVVLTLEAPGEVDRAGWLKVDGCTIVDKGFHGDSIEYVLQAASTEVKAKIPREASSFQVGQIVRLCVPRDRIAVFPG